VVIPTFNARELMLRCLQRLDDPAIARRGRRGRLNQRHVAGARSVAPRPCGIPQLYFGATLDRRLKRAIIRSRLPFKGPLARGYLRTVERYKSISGGHKRLYDANGLPVPSPRLRVLIAGTADPEHFLTSGRAHADYLRELLAGVGCPLDQMDAILDFGCGCGRIARWFSDLPRPQINGCDYNSELVEWCDTNLGFMQARKTELRPPLPYQNDSFDFLYACSVFTHLPVELAGRWMAEFRRVIKPGGLIWFTVHGEIKKVQLDPEEQLRFDSGEIVVWLPEIEGTNFCSTFWPNAAVESMLGSDFEVLVHLDPKAQSATAQKAQLDHDAYLVRRV